MEVMEWLAEVAKALVVKLAADAIEEAIRRAPESKHRPKHFRDREAK